MRSGILVILSLCCILLALGAGCLQQGPGTATGGGVQAGGIPAPSQLATTIPCTGNQRAFVTDLNVYQTPQLAEPAARVPFRDPVFGSCIVRVTDRKRDIDPGDSSKGMKNEYSRVESFNADGSRILVRGIAATWYLYDAQSLDRIEQISIGVDPRWDPVDPDTLYFVDGAMLNSYNIRNREKQVVHDFAQDFPGQQLAAVWTKYEGVPSADGRYWGLMAEGEDWTPVAYLIYDKTADRVVARRDMRGIPGNDPDNVSISPLGTYFVAQHEPCERGTTGTVAAPCGMMVYDNTLTTGRSLQRAMGHADFAFDAQGKEVLVFQDIDEDMIAMIDLGTGKKTPLVPIDFSHTPIGLHFSGQAYRVPGWAVVSTYNGGHPAAFTWMDDVVFAIELKKGGRVVRLAHTHSVFSDQMEKDYWAEPHASPNRDLTRILFTSNWERSGTDDVEMFMIDLPEGWTRQLAG